jgi:DEAD/DEAH box helicase domain-containing protein
MTPHRICHCLPAPSLLQLRSLRALLAADEHLSAIVTCCCLDGDTPFGDRGAVAEGGVNIVLTNPDMLHASVLPGHRRYSRLLKKLRYVVLDEAHTYR